MHRIHKTIAFSAAVLLCFLSFFSCSSKQSEKVVGACGGEEILYEELAYQMFAYRNQHPNATTEELTAAVESAICDIYAVLTLCAEHLPGQSIDSKEMKKTVDAGVASAIEDLGGKKSYKAYLKELNLTEHLFRRLLAITQLEIQLEEQLCAGTELETQESFLDWLDDGNFVRTKKFFFPFGTEHGESEMLTEAQAVQSQLKNGASAEELLTAEQTGKGIVLQPAGYSYRGMENTEMEAAALALEKAGDVSEPIRTDLGYYVLVRVEDERDTMVTYQLDAVFSRYRSDMMEKTIRETAKELTVEWNDYGKSCIG